MKSSGYCLFFVMMMTFWQPVWSYDFDSIKIIKQMDSFGKSSTAFDERILRVVVLIRDSSGVISNFEVYDGGMYQFGGSIIASSGISNVKHVFYVNHDGKLAVAENGNWELSLNYAYRITLSGVEAKRLNKSISRGATIKIVGG